MSSQRRQMNVSQDMARLVKATGARHSGAAAVASAGVSRYHNATSTGVNVQLLSVLQSAGKGAASAALKVQLGGTLKHKRTSQHQFEMTCQQPPVVIKFYPQSCTGKVEQVEILVDLRGEPSPEKHQQRFECSAEEEGHFEVAKHMSRPGNLLYIGVHMRTSGGSAYDVLQYELEVLTGTWNGAAPCDNCGRWLNENGHAFIGIWRGGKPHTGKGAWSALMRGKGEATLAVMRGEWRGGVGSGTLTTGPDAWRVGLDPGRTEAERKPWEVQHVRQADRLASSCVLCCISAAHTCATCCFCCSCCCCCCCRRPQVWEHDEAEDTTGWELHKFLGEWNAAGAPKTGTGEWMTQSRQLFEGTWQDFAGTGVIYASKRAGKASWDREDHRADERPKFVGEWVEEQPWDGRGVWFHVDDRVFEGSLKEGKPFTGHGVWYTSSVDDGCGELLEGFWWQGLKLGDAHMERVERNTVKANRATEHYFDVTVQDGPLVISCTPIQQAGTFSNLDLLVSTLGVPDLKSFQYRQECSVSKGGSITIDKDGFHPARFYVKIIVSSTKKASTGSNLYDFLQYLVEFKTGAWQNTRRVLKDSYGRSRWHVPQANNGIWTSADGQVYSGTFVHGAPMNGTGRWQSECGNIYEGTWENGKGSGTIVGLNAESYEGEWLDGWPTHGKGQFTANDENTYTPDEGTWSGGAAEGSIVHKNGATYWGSWEGHNPVEGRGKWVNRRGQLFEGNWSDGEGMGMIQSDDGEVSFEGEWKNEMPHRGKGSWRDTDGNVYEGEWRNGILYGKDLTRISVGNDLSKMEIGVDSNHVQSKQVSEADSHEANSIASVSAHGLAMVAKVKPKPGHRLVTGRQFEGEWRNGKPYTGLGMFRGHMGHVFDGSWNKGRPHEGKGAWLSEEGWIFDGEIRNGRVVQATGKWRCVLPLPNEEEESFDGRVFEGEWRDGVPYSGKGDWWDGHNHIYKGEWASLEGAGSIVMLPVPDVTEGGEFVGKWRGGLPLAGDGLWVDLDGYVYKGSWSKALPLDGQGEWNFADNVYNGRWEEGKGAGRVTGKQGSRFKGTWKGWTPWVGQGEFVDPEGHKFSGDWLGGAPCNGSGEWKSEDGHVYRGELRDTSPWNGEGSFKDVRRKCVYEGKWTQGDGQGTIYGEGGEIFHGSWKQGVPFAGKGAWRSKHMKVLEGEWEGSEGAGIIVGLKSGEKFEGVWGDGDGAPIAGRGRWLSEEGFANLYDGEWKDGRGSGRIRGAEGQKFSGDWWNLMPYKGKGMWRGPDGFDFQGVWKNGTRMWRGRKWKDSEVGTTEFKLRRSRFITGRHTPADRAAAASLSASLTQNRTAQDVAGKQMLAADATLTGRVAQLSSDTSQGTVKPVGDGAAVPHIEHRKETTRVVDAHVQRKIDALQAARDCGALSSSDFTRAKRRVLGASSDGSESGVPSETDSSDSESRDSARLRAVSMRSRRSANPWHGDTEFCPPGAPTDNSGRDSGSGIDFDSDGDAPTPEELRQLGLPAVVPSTESGTARSPASYRAKSDSDDDAPTCEELRQLGLLPQIDAPSALAAPAAHPQSPVALPYLSSTTTSRGDALHTETNTQALLAASSGNNTGSSRNHGSAQRTSHEEQKRHDEAMWALEAKQWAISRASSTVESAPVQPQLRYLRRSKAPTQLAPPKPTAGPDLFSVEGRMKKKEQAGSEPNSISPGDPYTLVVTCEHDLLFHGAHKIKVSCTDMAGLMEKMQQELGIPSEEESGQQLSIHVFDSEFSEFIVLSEFSDLPKRAKIRLVSNPLRSVVEVHPNPALREDTGGVSQRTDRPSDAETMEKVTKRSTHSGLAELRAARNRLLQSDPGMALRMRAISDGTEHLLADVSRGAAQLIALESFQDNSKQRRQERSMLRQMTNRAGTSKTAATTSDSSELQFDGEWRDCRPYTGKGSWLSPEGLRFSGTWRNGAPLDGHGAFCSARERVFDGEWVGGVPWTGEGEYGDQMGTVWSGRWKGGNGFGTLTVSSLNHTAEVLSSFSGAWKAGNSGPWTGCGTFVDVQLLDGGPEARTHGELELDLSVKATGEWRDGELFTGMGKWRSPISDILFDGEFEQGEGRGVYQLPGDTRTLPGRWKYGQVRVRRGSAASPNTQ
jgi:hypothetical protein